MCSSQALRGWPAMTSLLFTTGKTLLTVYLGHSTVGSP